MHHATNAHEHVPAKVKKDRQPHPRPVQNAEDKQDAREEEAGNQPANTDPGRRDQQPDLGHDRDNAPDADEQQTCRLHVNLPGLKPGRLAAPSVAPSLPCTSGTNGRYPSRGLPALPQPRGEEAQRIAAERRTLRGRMEEEVAEVYRRYGRQWHRQP
jgi:hypothetical protein